MAKKCLKGGESDSTGQRVLSDTYCFLLFVILPLSSNYYTNYFDACSDTSSVEIDTLSGLVDNNLCVIFYVFDVDRIDFDALFLLIDM
ncbi:hypothetical protein NQ317_004380 [Molorchus minor]|uniref:Uncharacterized protein n=1 Tax=Molorchus minor TaxID=1323400 RepID=A0ABQ9JTK2_9CUCU|nr:hypothetical protein NQ317_004380 [Molorchus minor]